MVLQTPKTLSHIPVAPGRLPVVGHLFKIARDQISFLMEMEQKLGPVYWLHQGFGHWTVVVAGDAAHTVMKNKATRSDIMGAEDDYVTHKTLLVNDGSAHKRMRGSMNSPFTPKGLTSAEVGRLLCEVAEERLVGWEQKRELRILHETSVFALDIIFRMLGIPATDLPLWRKKFDEFIGPWIIVPTTLPGSPRWKSRRAAEWMDRHFQVLVDKAIADGDRESMLGALAHGTDEEGKGLEPGELLANLRILALAGHETTASIIGWMFIHMADDELLWQQLCEEVMAADGPPSTPKEMASFPLTEALFREVLRLYPVVCLLPPRRVEEPIEAHGYELPRNTQVSASLVSLSRDPAQYPNPEKLDLSRWASRERKPKPSEAVQFGGGPHFCLGYHMAIMEGVVFAAAGVRKLVESGLKPTLRKGIPTPSFMPLTRPPSKLKLQLTPA